MSTTKSGVTFGGVEETAEEQARRIDLQQAAADGTIFEVVREMLAARDAEIERLKAIVGEVANERASVSEVYGESSISLHLECANCGRDAYGQDDVEHAGDCLVMQARAALAVVGETRADQKRPLPPHFLLNAQQPPHPGTGKLIAATPIRATPTMSNICGSCSGRGVLTMSHQNGGAGWINYDVVCPQCKGSKVAQ